MILGEVLRGVENGRYPPSDGSITLFGAPAGAIGAVVSFTGHVIVAADVPRAFVDARLRRWELADAYLPPFLGPLTARVHARNNAIDMLTLAPPAAGPPPVRLTLLQDRDHPRVRRACRYRQDVAAWAAEGGVVTIGRGLAGRWEVGIEVDPAYRCRGLGRALAAAARHLVPDGRPVWAQIAPGNAASVRAFLAAGYAPVGMEVLLVSPDTPPES